jgi:hypothetical protein
MWASVPSALVGVTAGELYLVIARRQRYRWHVTRGTNLDVCSQRLSYRFMDVNLFLYAWHYGDGGFDRRLNAVPISAAKNEATTARVASSKNPMRPWKTRQIFRRIYEPD